MNNLDELQELEVVLQAITIGSIVAFFLFNTSRVLKAVELWKECLIILNNKALDKNNMIIKLYYEQIRWIVIEGCCRINDYQTGIKYGRELLALYRQSGERTKERMVLFKLETLHQRQGDNVEAK